MGSRFQKGEGILYKFSSLAPKKGNTSGRPQFPRQFFPAGFGTLPKNAEEKVGKSKNHPKNGSFNCYFNAFTKFLQFFDHFIVEIFAGLDYNKNRKSEEGPRAEYRVG